uniref:Uncharacterized protein n=1 Tax=Lepeophtheirus salmonis TaxID=72036 RepID=A0A0K2SVF4_LEPSM
MSRLPYHYSHPVWQNDLLHHPPNSRHHFLFQVQFLLRHQLLLPRYHIQILPLLLIQRSPLSLDHHSLLIQFQTYVPTRPLPVHFCPNPFETPFPRNIWDLIPIT